MDSALAGPVVQKAHYAPVNPDILNFPVDVVSASGNKENVKPSGHDEQHVFSAHTASGGITKGNVPSGSKSQAKPGYKPFNPALLSGFENPVGNSRMREPLDNLRMTEPVWSTYSITGSDVELPVESSREREPFENSRMRESVWSTYANAGSDVERPVEGSQMRGPAWVASDNADSLNETLVDVQPGRYSRTTEPVWTTYANAGSTSSNEQESNPFRRARLNRSLPVPSSDDAAQSLFSQATTVAVTPREQFSASLSTGDVVTSVGLSMGGGRPRPRAEVDPEDYGFLTSSFGQRYTKDTPAGDNAVSNTPANIEDVDVGNTSSANAASNDSIDHDPENDSDWECVICAETNLPHEFPQASVTATCNHSPATCLDCVRMSIKTDLDTKIWTEIRCPECAAALDYLDIQKYADEETFSRYEQLALRATMSQADNFIWCTAGCGSGQIHDSDARHPIVTCLHCGQRSCFQHNVPWHEGLTCKEYDRLLADPENFRSRWENDDASEVGRRHQVEADRAVARGLVAGDEAALQRRMFKRRQREDKRKLEEAATRAREVAIKKKRDEERSVRTIGRTTKPCPGCGTSIEKGAGCSHMKCTKCKYEFCYECGANHKNILATDNSAHQRTCRFHPDNLE